MLFSREYCSELYISNSFSFDSAQNIFRNVLYSLQYCTASYVSKPSKSKSFCYAKRFYEFPTTNLKQNSIYCKSSQLYWADLNSAHSLLEGKLRFLLINDAFKSPSFGTKYAQIYDPRCFIFYSIKTSKSSTIFRRRFP